MMRLSLVSLANVGKKETPALSSGSISGGHLPPSASKLILLIFESFAHLSESKLKFFSGRFVVLVAQSVKY